MEGQQIYKRAYSQLAQVQQAICEARFGSFFDGPPIQSATIWDLQRFVLPAALLLTLAHDGNLQVPSSLRTCSITRMESGTQ